ncbi:hypothetical protein [Cytobacillus sp. NCCP-133]|uniref:hypothetical protein n=1 Tax=Cytobacillus sp. NCCP-133 TaxID=766848 RepID=UPI002231E2A1|nr:hypothetical protein [Cytobacillus sp. NCCP-133]GLB58660.1 hypothetical protein NCCP133_07930 [Cytobacillus sp. NCCP-133]
MYVDIVDYISCPHCKSKHQEVVLQCTDEVRVKCQECGFISFYDYELLKGFIRKELERRPMPVGDNRGPVLIANAPFSNGFLYETYKQYEEELKKIKTAEEELDS